MVRDMTALQVYGAALAELRVALPEHRYHHVDYNRSHGSASAHGTLRTRHNRLFEVAEEYITGYGIVPSLPSTAVLEEYRLLREAVMGYRDTLREDKWDTISWYLSLIDNAEMQHHALD